MELDFTYAMLGTVKQCSVCEVPFALVLNLPVALHSQPVQYTRMALS